MAKKYPSSDTEIEAIDAIVDAIQEDLGDPSTRTYNDTIEDMLGIPDLADATVYAGLAKDAIYVDTGSGITGTDYPNGTPEYPVNNIDDAIRIKDDRGIFKIIFKGTVTPTMDLDGVNIFGYSTESSTIDLNDVEVKNGTKIYECSIMGDADATGTDNVLIAEKCYILQSLSNFNDVFIYNSMMYRDIDVTSERLLLRDTTIMRGAGPISTYTIENSLQITGGIGNCKIVGLTAIQRHIVETQGEVELDATCDNGEMYVFGNTELADNSAEGFTVYDYTLQGRDKGLDRISDAVSKGTGTEIAADKAVADALGHDGTTDLDTGLMAQLRDYINDNPDSVYNRLGDPTARTNAQTILALLNLPDAAASTLYDFLVEGGDTSGQSANVDGGIVEILKYLAADTHLQEEADTFTYLDAGGEQDIFEITPTTMQEVLTIVLDLSNMTQDGTWKLYINGEEEDTDTRLTTDNDKLFIAMENLALTETYKISWEEDADETADRAIPYSVRYRGD